MIQSISVLDPKHNTNIEVLSLSEPSKSGLAITNVEGLGPPGASINLTEYAMRDGSFFNSARINTRNLVIYITFVGDCIEDLRRKCYDLFPVKQPVRIRVLTDKRSAHIDGYVESNEPTIFSNQETTQISIICPDPLWYGSSMLHNVDFMETEPLFHFPFSNPKNQKTLVMGAQIWNPEKTISYEGDTGAGILFTLKFKGPVGDFIFLENKTSGQKMTIDVAKLKRKAPKNFEDFGDRDDIVVNTISGNKSILLKYIRDSRQYTRNILDCLTLDSDWLYLVKGDNVISLSVSGNQYNLRRAYVQYTVQYWGI